MMKIVRECNEYLGYLLDRIDINEALHQNLHSIVMSDHGMEQVNGTTNPMYMENYVDRTKMKAYRTSTVMNIFIQTGKRIYLDEVNYH